MRILAALVLLLSLAAPGLAEEKKEKWGGIDETIIERYATDRGRVASTPLISVEGDMLLFLFALAGAAGGFVMGYYWHKVFVAGKSEAGNRNS